MVVLQQWAAMLCHTTLSLCLLINTWRENIMKKGSLHEIRTEISLINYQTQHREINVIYYLLLIEWSTEKLKANSKHLSSIHSLLLHVMQGNEDCSQSMILYLLHGHCLPLLHMGSLPQSAILSQLIHVNIDMCTINICQVCGKLGKL